MSKDRSSFIQNLKSGDEVHWTDPGDGVSSGTYKVVEIYDSGVSARNEHTVVYLRNEAGSEAEVWMHELT